MGHRNPSQRRRRVKKSVIGCMRSSRRLHGAVGGFEAVWGYGPHAFGKSNRCSRRVYADVMNEQSAQKLVSKLL